MQFILRSTTKSKRLGIDYGDIIISAEIIYPTHDQREQLATFTAMTLGVPVETIHFTDLPNDDKNVTSYDVWTGDTLIGVWYRSRAREQ